MDGSPAHGLVDAAGQAINLLDREAVREAVQRLRPTAVIHLDAQSFVPEAFKDPITTYESNFIGTQILLEAGFSGRFLLVSSADVYRSLDASELPETEQSAVKPNNPYALSKIAAETLCSYWHRTEGMQINIARPFNHIEPGQSTRFALADLIEKAASIKGAVETSYSRLAIKRLTSSLKPKTAYSQATRQCNSELNLTNMQKQPHHREFIRKPRRTADRSLSKHIPLYPIRILPMPNLNHIRNIQRPNSPSCP